MNTEGDADIATECVGTFRLHSCYAVTRVTNKAIPIISLITVQIETLLLKVTSNLNMEISPSNLGQDRPLMISASPSSIDMLPRDLGFVNQNLREPLK